MNGQLERCQKQITQLSEQQAELQHEIELNSRDIDIEGIIGSLKNFKDCLVRAGNDPELKRDFIRSRVWEIGEEIRDGDFLGIASVCLGVGIVLPEGRR